MLFAVIVTYHPDPAALNRLVGRLRAGDAQVVVVDNTAKGIPENLDCELISMGSNAGIAAAQNVGIRAALARGAQAIAFFDQDSTPDAALLPALAAALGQPPLGVVAPVCVDVRTGQEYPPYRFNRCGWASPTPARGQPLPFEVDLVISSGSVVAADVFDRSGMMSEDFFIDYVDLEWCIRCRRAGVPIRVIPSVTMSHAIGDKAVQNGPITTFVHSPVRAYYRLRNALLLARIPHVPRVYAVREILSALLHHLAQWRHSRDRRQHAWLGIRALGDGLRGIRGKIELT